MAKNTKGGVGASHTDVENLKEKTKELHVELDITRQISNAIREQLSLVKGNLDFKSSTRKALRDINKLSEQNVDLLEDEMRYALKLSDIGKRQNKLKETQLSMDRERGIITLKIKRTEEEINSLNNSKGDKIKKKSLDEELKAYKAINQGLGDSINQSRIYEESLNQVSDITKKIEGNSSKKLFASLSDITQAIPGLRKFSEPFDKAAASSREVVANAHKTNEEFKKDLELYKEKLLFDKKLGTNEAEKFAETRGEQGAWDLQKGKLSKDPLKGINFKAAKAGFKSLGSVITKALGPISLAILALKGIKSVFDTMLSQSENIARFRQDFSMTREQAELFKQDMHDVAFSTTLTNKETKGIAISQKMVEKSLYAINEQLGTQLNLIQDYGDQTKVNVAFASILLDKLKLSGQATTKLFSEATSLNIPLEEHTKKLLGGITYLGHQNNLMFDQKKILEETAGITGEMRAHFKNSSVEMSKVVYQSKLLGFNLSNIKSISTGLLDFESSIGSEMEAILLTGMDINLEGARYAALMGDAEGVMREITNQGITQENYAKMNVVSRQAIAAALGMSSDELADQLVKQKENNDLALKREKILDRYKSIRLDDFNLEKDSYEVLIEKAKAQGLSLEETYDLLGKNIILQKQSESAQERFNKVLDQAREIFAQLIDGGILDSVVAVLEGLANSALLAPFKDRAEAKKASKELKEEIDKDETIPEEEKIAQKKEIDDLHEQGKQKKGGLQRTGDYLGGFVASAALGLGKVVTLGLNDTVNSGFDNAVKSLKDTYNDQDAFDTLMVKKKKSDNEKITSTDPDTLDNEKITSTDPNVFDNLEVKKKKSDNKKVTSTDENEKTITKDPTTENHVEVADFISRPGQPPIKFRKDDLIIGGTQLTSKEKGPITNNSSDNSMSQETNVLLKRLISIVEQGGDVNLDGNKVGTILAMNASQLG